MDDFFETIYLDAAERGTLNPDFDPGYRAARTALDALLTALVPDEDRRDELESAVYRLADRSDLVSLAYGFRLGVRVTAPVFPAPPAPAGRAPHFYSACP